MSGTEEKDEKGGKAPPEETQVTESKALQVSTGKEVSDGASEPVDDELVEETVKFLHETVRKFVYKGSQVMGTYILEKFFDNDIERARSRNPNKKASYRKLKSHPNLPFHPSTLHISVQVAVQEIFFAEHHVDTSQVPPTHLGELVKLPDDEEKIKLLQRILNENLHSRELERIVLEKRKGSIESKTGELEVLLSPSQLVKDLKGLFDPKMIKRLDIKPEELNTLEPEQRNELKGKIGETLTKLKEVSQAYKKLLSEIRDLEAKGKGKE